MINVLYLDDEAHNLTAFRAAFRRDFQVHVTTEPTDAVRILKEHPIEVIISDQKMPKLSGVEFFELIAPDYPDPVRMLLTGHADIDAVIDAINKRLTEIGGMIELIGLANQPNYQAAAWLKRYQDELVRRRWDIEDR